jgi:hypothetical protein
MNKAINLNIDQRYFPAIGRFFSPIVLNSLEKENHSSYLSEVCKNSGLLTNIDLSITLGKFFDIVFQFLLKNYRNEYIYKNIIANKILLGRHSLNTSQMLTELRVGKNKADVVILNGSSTVYEIKTEYDSFKRLDEQLQSYLMAFEYINLITSPSQSEIIKKYLPDAIGLLSFTENNTISTIREPKSNLENINLEFLFDSLRKKEYLSIISKYYGKLPDVPNTKIHQISKNLYCNIPLINAHKLTIEALKKRNNSKYLKDCIDKAPYSSVAYLLGIGDQEKKIKNMIKLFSKELNHYI